MLLSPHRAMQTNTVVTLLIEMHSRTQCVHGFVFFMIEMSLSLEELVSVYGATGGAKLLFLLVVIYKDSSIFFI